VTKRAGPTLLPEYGPCAFFDLQNGIEISPTGKSSICNPREVTYVVNLVKKLMKRVPKQEIVVITFYSLQVLRIRERLEANDIQDVRVETVDSFQGSEATVTILSFVRSNEDVGFVSQPNRLNVAITRAKHGLFMVGSAATLSSSTSEDLRALIQNMRYRGVLHPVCAADETERDTGSKLSERVPTRPSAREFAARLSYQKDVNQQNRRADFQSQARQAVQPPSREGPFTQVTPGAPQGVSQRLYEPRFEESGLYGHKRGSEFQGENLAGESFRRIELRGENREREPYKKSELHGEIRESESHRSTELWGEIRERETHTRSASRNDNRRRESRRRAEPRGENRERESHRRSESRRSGRRSETHRSGSRRNIRRVDTRRTRRGAFPVQDRSNTSSRSMAEEWIRKTHGTQQQSDSRQHSSSMSELEYTNRRSSSRHGGTREYRREY